MNQAQITVQAEGLLKESGYRFGEDSYVNIMDFIHRFDFVAGNACLEDNADGFLAVYIGNKAIGANVNLTLAQKRLIIAHEFAYFVLYANCKETYLHWNKRSVVNRKEKLAGFFARELLMPRELFLRLYRQLQEKDLNETMVCLQLASAFKVPSDSVLDRIREVCGVSYI